MSRKKTEINPERVERLKTIMKRENYNQKELSRELWISQQGLSEIMRLKNPLTESRAEEVIKLFPDYRLAWLLGYDDYMTEEEYQTAMSNRAVGNATKESRWFSDLCSLADIDYSVRYYDGDRQATGVTKKEDALEFVDKEGIECFPDRTEHTVAKDKMAAVLTDEELGSLKDELFRFFEFRMNELFRERGN